VESLEPVAARRVVDDVRDRLRHAIVTGDLPPGARLSVPDLARQLRVSRSPVREAVLQLVAEGLAVEHTRRGVEVARVQQPDLEEIYEIRAVIEGLAARVAATRLNASGLAELAGLHAAQRVAAERGDAPAYRELDMRFHHLIVNHASYTRVERITKLLAGEVLLAARLLANDAAHFRLSHAEHARILDALHARDGHEAERAMRDHLHAVTDRIRQRLAARPASLSEVRMTT